MLEEDYLNNHSQENETQKIILMFDEYKATMK